MRGLDVLDTRRLVRLVLVVSVSCLLEVCKYAGEDLVFTDQRKREEVRGNRTLQSTPRGISLK